MYLESYRVFLIRKEDFENSRLYLFLNIIIFLFLKVYFDMKR